MVCFGNDLKYLRIGELAEKAGVSTRTIDYYTQLGLLDGICRSPGKHRLYSQGCLKTIRIVKELQKQHYTLEEISHLFQENENSDLVRKVVSIRQRLDDLQKEIAELHPVIQKSAPNEQVKVLSRELTTKGVQIMQALMIILGEPML